jgi:hypothetical protein
MTWTNEDLHAKYYQHSEFVGRDERTHAANARNQECRCRILVIVLGNRQSKSLTRPQRSEPIVEETFSNLYLTDDYYSTLRLVEVKVVPARCQALLVQVVLTINGSNLQTM